MFTGIVEELGAVVASEGLGTDARLTIRGPLVTSTAAHGDSISVNGVCLTVTTLDAAAGTFGADVMPETLRLTQLGTLRPGDPVNLERAALVGGRLDGHIVQGHVDGVGRLRSRTPGERWEDLVVEAPADVLRYVVHKGSITVSGVSLTVTHVDDDSFGVSLIPTTLAATTLGALVPGDAVNLEVDVVAKYVEKLMGARA